MPIIDIHTHIFPDHVAPAAISALEQGADVEAVYDGTLTGLVAVMDRAGIAQAVIQPVTTKASQVPGVNDWAASCASERIIPFGTVHPDIPDPASEIARMAALGLRGFKMHPEYQVFQPHEERMSPIYEAAIEHDMTILFHAGIDIEIPTLHGTPDSFARMLDRHPGLSAILAHMGGFRQWDGVAEYLVGREVFFDTSYTLGHLPDDDFVALVEAHGADRILFGTDGPWADPATEVARIRTLGLPGDALDAIMGGNAERLLCSAAS